MVLRTPLRPLTKTTQGRGRPSIWLTLPSDDDEDDDDDDDEDDDEDDDDVAAPLVVTNLA